MRASFASFPLIWMLSLLLGNSLLAGGCGGSSAANDPDDARSRSNAAASGGEGGGSPTDTTGTVGGGSAGREAGGAASADAAGAAGSAAGNDSTSPEGGAGGLGAGGQAGTCEPAQIMFVVSRSGAMFGGVPAPWDPIREAALAALKTVDGVAELGFLAVTGQVQANICPLLDEVAPGPARYPQIKSLYNSLAAPVKGESPFMYGLDRAGELFTGAGKKYIVFVLNGEADYCTDGLPACPTDSVIAHLQALNDAGVTTLVAAAPPLLMDEPRTAAYESALQGYANAGVGLPTTSHDDPILLNQMCSSSLDSGAVAWREELEASGKPDSGTLADYSETSGDAPYISLDPSDLSGMTDALTSLLESIATCD
jgi:hypothetical protein